MTQSPVTANFFPTSDPSQQAQMLDMYRKQLMAQQLMDNAQMPNGNDMAGNVVIKHSPLEYLSHAVSGAMGRNAQIDAMKEQYALQGNQFAALLNGLSGGGTTGGGAGGSAGGGLGLDRNKMQAAYLTGGQQGLADYVKSAIAPTDKQKDYGWMGIDPQNARAMTLNEGGAKSNGANYTIGPNGFSASPVPGYSGIQADIAGRTTGAQKAAEAPYTPPMPIPDSNGGTHYMTPLQYNTGPGAQSGIPPLTPASVQQAQQTAPNPFPAPGLGSSALSGIPQPAPLSNNIPRPPPPDSSLPPLGGPLTDEQASKLPPTVAAGPALSPPVIGVGPSDAQKEGDKNTATKLSDVQNTMNIMQANLPMALKRFEDMRKASDNASSGMMVNEDGDGYKQQFWNQFGGKTADANNMLEQKAAQGILPELGPQLAQAGVKGNKFLETIANNASGLNMSAPPETKKNLINGLETTYINNLKATASQLRQMGRPAPTDEQIEQMVQQHKAAMIQPQAGAQKSSATQTRTINGKTYTNVNGQWYEQ